MRGRLTTSDASLTQRGEQHRANLYMLYKRTWLWNTSGYPITNIGFLQHRQKPAGLSNIFHKFWGRSSADKSGKEGMVFECILTVYERKIEISIERGQNFHTQLCSLNISGTRFDHFCICILCQRPHVVLMEVSLTI